MAFKNDATAQFRSIESSVQFHARYLALLTFQDVTNPVRSMVTSVPIDWQWILFSIYFVVQTNFFSSWASCFLTWFLQRRINTAYFHAKFLFCRSFEMSRSFTGYPDSDWMSQKPLCVVENIRYRWMVSSKLMNVQIKLIPTVIIVSLT